MFSEIVFVNSALLRWFYPRIDMFVISGWIPNYKITETRSARNRPEAGRFRTPCRKPRKKTFHFVLP